MKASELKLGDKFTDPSNRFSHPDHLVIKFIVEGRTFHFGKVVVYARDVLPSGHNKTGLFYFPLDHEVVIAQ